MIQMMLIRDDNEDYSDDNNNNDGDGGGEEMTVKIIRMTVVEILMAIICMIYMIMMKR